VTIATATTTRRSSIGMIVTSIEETESPARRPSYWLSGQSSHQTLFNQASVDSRTTDYFITRKDKDDSYNEIDYHFIDPTSFLSPWKVAREKKKFNSDNNYNNSIKNKHHITFFILHLHLLVTFNALLGLLLPFSLFFCLLFLLLSNASR
jgi:hypothetical protein